MQNKQGLDELPVYDFENDTTISEKRKEACRLSYLEMRLHHIDKIFTSTFIYDKKTGEPTSRKPKSLHELVYFLLKSDQALSSEIHYLHQKMAGLLKHLGIVEKEKEKH